jgi:hypothetical protein
MILEIVGKYLDNGFNIRDAVKDTFELKKNTANLIKNKILYNKLLERKIGIWIENFDVFCELGISVNFFIQNKIISLTAFEGDFSCSTKIVDLTQDEESSYDSYFPNNLVHYLLIMKNNPSLVFDLNEDEKIVVQLQEQLKNNKEYMLESGVSTQILEQLKELLKKH